VKKLTKYLTLLFLLILFPSSIYAKETRTKSTITGDTVVIEKNEVIDRDIFVAAETIKVFGTVNGDLYAGGSTIIISGTVNGDLLATGGTVNILGNVTQDARVAGGQVNVNGEIGRNLSAAGGNIDISSDAKVMGSVALAGGNINIDAPIRGNLTAGAGNLTLSNTVGGDIETALGTATLTANAKVDGDFVYWSEEDATISNEASISGVIVKNDPRERMNQADIKKAQESYGKFKGVFGGTARVISIISTIITGLILIKLFPKFSENVVLTLREKTWASLGYGSLAVLFIPIVLVFIFLTVVGIPIALISFAIYMVYVYIAKMFVIILIGQYVSAKIDKKMDMYKTFIMGAVVYFVLTLIPIVAGIIKILSLLFGFGALLITCKKTHQEALKKAVI